MGRGSVLEAIFAATGEAPLSKGDTSIAAHPREIVDKLRILPRKSPESRSGGAGSVVKARRKLGLFFFLAEHVCIETKD